jgi:hypothetical protein
MNFFRQIRTRRHFRPAIGVTGVVIAGGAGRSKLAGFQAFSEAQAAARRPRTVGPVFMKVSTERGLNNG